MSKHPIDRNRTATAKAITPRFVRFDRRALRDPKIALLWRRARPQRGSRLWAFLRLARQA